MKGMNLLLNGGQEAGKSPVWLYRVLFRKFIVIFFALSFCMTASDASFAEGQGQPKEEDYSRMPAVSSQKIAGQGAEYKVGVDDVLDISVIKPEKIESTAVIAPDGTVTFPYIGNVHVEGLSLPAIQDEIQRRLANGYMEYPLVSVSLKATRSKKFTIYGQVVRPNAYPVQEGMTILRAITEAGGFIVPGSTGKVKLLRPQGPGREAEVVESDINAILNGAVQETVLPGDTVIVMVDKFFVYGQVNKPGAYPVEENMTILHAITVAGGFIQSGSTGRVKLFRPHAVNNEFKVIESDIKDILSGANQDITILAGDTIVVSADKFFVSGQVNRPGAYPVEENMTLLQAITVAGGFMESGSTGKVKLLRKEDVGSESVVSECDIKAVLNGMNKSVFVLPGDTIVVSADKFFVSGQVVRPGVYPAEENMTLLRAITLAGGFVESGSTAGKVKLLRPKSDGGEFEMLETDITAVLSGTSHSVMVLPGDTIVVSSDKFFVYGEVMRPGMYPLETRTTALTAISMAGGFTKFGSANRVKILRVNGESGAYDAVMVNINDILAGNSKADVVLEPRDIVVVSEGVF